MSENPKTEMASDLHDLADRINRIPAVDADQHDALVGAAMKARTIAYRCEDRTSEEWPA